jgi:LuxR family quorum sensing-dependent transcriptional regulator
MQPRDVPFDFLRRSASIDNAEDLLADLRATLQPYGFDHLMMTNLPTGQANVRPLVMLQGWPRDWFERYVEERYYAYDAVTVTAAASRDPFIWSSLGAAASSTPLRKRIAGEAVEFGLADGLLIPMLAPSGWQAVVSLGSSEAVELSPEEEASILLTSHLANRVARGLVGEPQVKCRLSPRERDVVSWIAAGKTAWEISSILSLSEDTVKFHIKSARRKLNVITSPQIVAEAIRLHEIDV